MAEKLNTVTNLSFVVFGILGAHHELMQRSKRSYVLLNLSIAAIGVGSMLFHGTLTHWGQQADELPMVRRATQPTLKLPSHPPTLIRLLIHPTIPFPSLVQVWHLLIAMYCVSRDAVGTNARTKSVVSGVLLAYAGVFSVVHVVLKTTTAFQVHFGVLLSLVLARMSWRFRKVDAGELGRQVTSLFFATGLSAFAFWLMDYHHCEWMAQLPTPWGGSFPLGYGHSLWHLLMGYSAFCSVLMLKVWESAEAGKPLELKYWLGLPFTCRVGSGSGSGSAGDLEGGSGSAGAGIAVGGKDLF